MRQTSPVALPSGDIGSRSDILLSAVLFLLFSTLIIDGYPAGAAVLREFGARPTNFILALSMMGILSRALLSTEPITFSRSEVLFALIVLVGIPALNLPDAMLLQPENPAGPLFVDWIKQYGMLLWGLASYLTWRRLLRTIGPLQLSGLICLGAILPLIAFYADFAGVTPVQAMLGTVRTKDVLRPSGMATEPSLYSSWVAFIWPLVFYHARHARSLAARSFAMTIFILACLSAFLSHARTIAVIVILQLLYYGYWTTRSSGGLLRLRALVITAFVSMVMLAGFAESLSSLGDRDVQSNISRIGATVTAMRVAMAYPYFGIGIGQLKYFFGAYAPDFALASDEILTYATRLSEYRASAFNLFVRFFCEFGFAVGAAFSFVVLRPIFTAVRRASADSAVACATLSAIGGAGFWLSQDQYGYQPGILSLAILAGVLSAEPNDRPRRPS